MGLQILRLLKPYGLASSNGDRCVEAHGLRGQMNLNYAGLLATFWRILGDTKFLFNMLPSSSLDSQLTSLRHYRTHLCTTEMKHFFRELWTEVLDVVQQCNISTKKVSKKQPKISSALHWVQVLFSHPQLNSETVIRTIFV